MRTSILIKQMPHYNVLIFGVLLLPILLHAQISKPIFVNYTTADGLCYNKVNDILQDSRGFMWMATREGLSRFDGTKFKNFFSGGKDSATFPSNDISCLHEYKKDHLIFISNGRIWAINTITQQFYECGQFRDKRIYYFSKSHSGKYFFSGIDTCYVSDSTLQKVEVIIPPTKTKNRGIEGTDLDKNTWLVNRAEEHFLYSIKSKKFTRFPLTTGLSSVIDAHLDFAYYDARHQALYFKNYTHGLFRFSMNGGLGQHWHSGTYTHGLSDNAIASVLPQSDSTLIIGMQSFGFGLLNIHTGLVKQFIKIENDPSSFASNAISSIYIDRQKNTWLATADGVSKLCYRTAYVKSWREQFSGNNRHDELQDITKGADGNMYAAFYLGSTYKINKDNDSVTALNSSEVGAWSLHTQGENLYITGGGKFLLQYNTATGRYKSPDFLKSLFPTSDVVVTGFKNRSGDVWYSGNMGGGLVRISANDGLIYTYKKDGPHGRFFNSYYPCHAETADGNLWFGVNKSGLLLQWSKATDYFKEINFDTVQGTLHISFNGINAVVADKENNIWVGYDGTGIVKYNPVSNTANHFTLYDGLPSNQISFLRFDGKGRLWIGTPKGLSYLVPETKKFVTLKRGDGLPTDIYEENCSYYDTALNKLWIGTANVLLTFNPDTLLASAKSSFPIYIDEVWLNGKKSFYNAAKTVELASFENNLQFQFIGVDIDNGKDIEYSYQVEGADAGWIYNGSVPSASYANLAAGKYKFRVRARHKGDNAWTEMAEPFSFRIRPHWSKSWWFLTLLIVAGSLLTWAIIRAYYLRKLEGQKAIIEKQNAVSKERSRIAADMHDDMGAGLSRMRYLSTALKKDIVDEEKKKALDKLITGSDELVDKMNDIIWTLNSNDGHLEDLLYYIRSQCSEMLDEANIDFVYHLPSLIPKRMVSSEQKRNLYLVVKEAVHNAIKHSKANTVHLKIETDSLLIISITDNGTGFSTVQTNSKGNGLNNYKKRMAALNGTFAIQSDENGTMVIFQAPIT